MTSELFLQPRLVGDRFEGHAIPLEFLKDLAVLEEMIIEVAKSEYLKDYPNRKRVPRGFTDGIELKLTGVEDGSARPAIWLFVASAALFPLNQTYFEKARDTIIRGIGAAEQNLPITEHLPEQSLGYFDRIGRSLRDREAIEFTTPTHETPARLTKETRRKLVLASTTVKELTEDCKVFGTIPEADQDRMTFEIQIFDGRKVKAQMTSQHQEDILKAFIGYKDEIRVQLQGIGKFSRQGKLLEFVSIEHISLLDPLDVPARLDELSNLKDGWLEGKGIAPRREGLDRLAYNFDEFFPEELPLPFVYPTPVGGVQAEWSIGSNEVTLEIDLESASGEWHCLNISSSAEVSRIIDLNTKEGWEYLTSQIRQMAGEAA